MEEDPRWREQQGQSSQSRNLLGMLSVVLRSTRRPAWLEQNEEESSCKGQERTLDVKHVGKQVKDSWQESGLI